MLVCWGQSNFGGFGNNSGGGYTPVSSKVDVFNWYDGGMYRAIEVGQPLVGTDGGFLTPGHYSSPVPRIADKLIAANACDRVILVLGAMGGTSTADWASGIHAGRLQRIINRMKAVGLVPTCLLRHQGEADPPLGTDRDTYAFRVRAEIQKFRDEGFTAPALVALATYHNGINTPGSGPVTEVRAGQALAVDGVTIFQGPDTDTLGAGYRSDGAHFNASGLDAHATLWVAPIIARATPIS